MRGRRAGAIERPRHSAREQGAPAANRLPGMAGTARRLTRMRFFHSAPESTACNLGRLIGHRASPVPSHASIVPIARRTPAPVTRWQAGREGRDPTSAKVAFAAGSRTSRRFLAPFVQEVVAKGDIRGYQVRYWKGALRIDGMMGRNKYVETYT